MRKGNKAVIIAVLLFVVLGMGVGYSILSKQLKIEGTATIENDLNVEIVAIKTGEELNYYGVEQCFDRNTLDYCEKSSTGVVTQNTPPSFTSTTANFDVTLGVNSVARYVVVLKNTGSLNAEISNVTINKTGSTAITLTTPRDVKGHFLRPGETLRYFVELSYSANSEVFDSELTSNVSITFDIIQKLSGYEGEENPMFIYFADIVTPESGIPNIRIAADNQYSLAGSDLTYANNYEEGIEPSWMTPSKITSETYHIYDFSSGIASPSGITAIKVINGDNESNVLKMTAIAKVQ